MWRSYVAASAIGLVVGCFAGFFGVGGGVLLVPALIWFFRRPAHEATATSLCVIVLVSIVATAKWALQGEVHLVYAIYLGLGSVVGAFFIGVPLAKRLSDAWLKRLFGALLTLVALKIIFAPEFAAGSVAASVPVVALAGLLIGVVSSLFGVGGGIIAVPVLTLLFGLLQHAAHGTSMAIIIPTSIAGVAGYYRSTPERLNLKMATLLAPGSLIGAVLGPTLAAYVSNDSLRSAFGIVMILMAARMLASPAAKAAGKNDEAAAPAK